MIILTSQIAVPLPWTSSCFFFKSLSPFIRREGLPRSKDDHLLKWNEKCKSYIWLEAVRSVWLYCHPRMRLGKCRFQRASCSNWPAWGTSWVSLSESSEHRRRWSPVATSFYSWKLQKRITTRNFCLERPNWQMLENLHLKERLPEALPADFLSSSGPGHGIRLARKRGGRRKKGSFPFLNLNNVVNHHLVLLHAAFVCLHIKHLLHWSTHH